MQSEALRLLEDEEVRVRLATGQLLGALAAKKGPVVFKEARQRVLTSILEHYVSLSIMNVGIVVKQCGSLFSNKEGACGVQQGLAGSAEQHLGALH